MTNAVEIHNLTKTYGSQRGVKDLNMTIEKGDIFGFLGPNGAGKSTTIRCILGLIHYQSSQITVLGYDAKKDHRQLMRKIGYMPSEAMFYPEMKVSKIIQMAASIRGLDCRHEAKKLCERLEVPIDKKINELSLGNRKKVSIVCAMQHKPELFIFDEPTSGLDPLIQAEFFKLISEYNKQGATCLLSSHVLSEIKKYCKHAAILKESRLIRSDTIINLTNTNTKQIHMIKDGIEENFIYKGNLNELFASFQGHDITDIVIEDPKLDQIFMHYYK